MIHLGNLDLTLMDELYTGTVSNNLRTALQLINVALPPKPPRVYVEKLASEWLIDCHQQKLLVRKKGPTLEVFRLVLQASDSLTSAYKNVYLFLFLFTGGFIILDLLVVGTAAVNANKTASEEDKIVFLGLMLLMGIALVCHLLRMYITMEQLEDPFSQGYRNYIAALQDNQSSLTKEQYARMFVICVVSSKTFLPRFTEFWQIGVFLLILYSSLLTWDVIMVRTKHFEWKKTYWLSSIGGLIGSFVMIGIGIAPHYTKSSLLLPGIAAVVYVVLVIVTFVFEWRQTGRMRVFDHFKKLLKEFVAPYYGQFCAKEKCVVPKP